MRNYVQSKECKRKLILSYFDQILGILNSITCAAHAQISANEILC